MRVFIVVGFLTVMFQFHLFAQEKVVLQLIWDHQFQFAGFYAAKWKGYYAAEDLAVEIRSAVKPDKSYLQATDELKAGRADFGLAGANIILERARGVPFRVLAVIFQRSPVAFYYREELGRITPSHLVNLRVARRIGGIADVEFQSMLRAEGIDPSLIKPYPPDTGIAHLASGQVDLAPGYTLATGWVAEKKGLRVKMLLPEDFGVDFYGDTLITHQRVIDRDPQMVERFVRASLKGWEYALNNSDEIARRIARDLPREIPVKDPVGFNLFQAEEVKKLMVHPFVKPGNVNPHRWRRMFDHLRQSGLVEANMNIDGIIFDPMNNRHRQRRILLIILSALSGFALLAVIGFVVWTKTLRRVLNTRTTELRQSEERYALVMTASNDGLWDWNFLTGEEFFSPRWKEIFGYGPDEPDPHMETVAAMLHPDDQERGRNALDSHLKNREPYNLEVRLRHTKGHYVWVRIKGQAVWNARGEPIRMAGSASDITERKIAEDEIQNLNAELEGRVAARTRELELAQAELVKKERLAVLGQLTATVSHELRNPLGVITNSVFTLIKQLKGNAGGTTRVMDRILRNVRRCSIIIEDMLEFVRTQDPFLEPIEFIGWLKQLLQDYQIPKNISLKLDLPAEKAVVLLDSERFRRAMINLLENACQAMEDIEGNAEAQGEIIVSVQIDSGNLVVHIEDTGPGLSEEVMDHIYEPLFSTKSFGVGLGLPIVQKILESHQGTISLSNRENHHGAKVTLKIPHVSKNG